jgi:hypothetical protein
MVWFMRSTIEHHRGTNVEATWNVRGKSVESALDFALELPDNTFDTNEQVREPIR